MGIVVVQVRNRMSNGAGEIWPLPLDMELLLLISGASDLLSFALQSFLTTSFRDSKWIKLYVFCLFVADFLSSFFLMYWYVNLLSVLCVRILILLQDLRSVHRQLGRSDTLWFNSLGSVFQSPPRSSYLHHLALASDPILGGVVGPMVHVRALDIRFSISWWLT